MFELQQNCVKKPGFLFLFNSFARIEGFWGTNCLCPVSGSLLPES